ncbi:hypothetical protein VNO77_37492 [Canavalia gladiata]|uniref:Vps8 RING finger domain-containing protein n=1 Tax=Canavalia gladiata TaxID=3824 RepID=A0AAN9KB57_CANGL
MHGTTLRHRDFPPTTFLQVDDVVLTVHGHRDMCTNIEDMSYEDEYNDQDKIGVLKCGHEYHEGCLRKRLLEKKSAPCANQRH